MAAKNDDDAITALRQADATQSADWHNLMGYSLRQKNPPDLVAAEKHDQEGLNQDPKHRGALAYQGELLLLKKRPRRRTSPAGAPGQGLHLRLWGTPRSQEKHPKKYTESR